MAAFDANYFATLGAALRSGKEEPSGKDKRDFLLEAGILKEKERLDALQDRRKQYEVIMSALSEENIDRMQLGFKYQQERNKMIRLLTDSALDANQAKSLVASLKKNQADGQKILDDLDQYSWPELDQILEKSVKVQGGDRNVALLQALTRENAYADGKRIANPQNLAQANSIRKALEQVEFGGKQLFQFDAQGILTNYDELADPQNSPLLQLGIEPSEIETNYFKPNNIFDEYNKSRQLIVDDLNAINEEHAAITAKIETLETLQDPQKILDVAKQIADGFTLVDEVMRDGSGIELENVEQLGEEIEIYNERKANAAGLKKEIEQLSGTPKKQQTVEQKQLLSKLEKRAANPYIREWAADHGFDEMGTVAYDKSGRPIPGSYVPGRDDAAIEKTFEREFQRGAGRYGFQSIGTGDIVQFQHEGKTVVGERLKFHAADRGAVRVVVPGIEEPIVIPAGSNTRFILLDRKPDKMSPLARRAKGLLFRRGDKIESLSNRFKIDDRSESVARENGRLVLDKATGRYVEQADFDELLRSKLAETEFVGKFVGGKQYIVDPNGNVFSMDRDNDGNLNLNPVEDEALLQTVNAAESRALSAIIVDENGEKQYPPLTQAALDSGELDGIGMANLESDPGGISEKSRLIFSNVAKQRRDQALQGMNVEVTDEEYDPLRGQTKNERTVMGHRFVELEGDPEAVKEFKSVETVKAAQEGRQPESVTSLTDSGLEAIATSTADEAADTAAADTKPFARRRAEKLKQAFEAKQQEVLSAPRGSGGQTSLADQIGEAPDPSLTGDDPLDLTGMSDEQARQRAVGPAPGLTQEQQTILRRRQRAVKSEPASMPAGQRLESLKRGIYEGKGGYKYNVDFDGNITIAGSPTGRGIGTPIRPGTPAHLAVVGELSQAPDPKSVGLDEAVVAPLLPAFSSPTVTSSEGDETTDKDEVKDEAGTPASGIVPGVDTDPSDLADQKQKMDEMKSNLQSVFGEGLKQRRRERRKNLREAGQIQRGLLKQDQSPSDLLAGE